MVERRKVRRKSPSVDGARARDLRRFSRLAPLERVLLALALGRRGRRLRAMLPGGGGQ